MMTTKCFAGSSTSLMSARGIAVDQQQIRERAFSDNASLRRPDPRSVGEPEIDAALEAKHRSAHAPHAGEASHQHLNSCKR